MKTKIFLVITMIIGVFASTGIVFFQGVSSGKAEPEQLTKKKKPPLVRVIAVETSKISETLELTGTAEPYRVARLASPAEGPVERIRVRESDQVKADEELVSIGRKKAVDALIISLREELKKEEDNLSRTRQLVQSEALPGEELDKARAEYEKIRAQFVKAEETARDYTVKAPWAGVVSRVNVKEGEFVAPRAVLLEMYDPGSLVIRAAVPETHAAEVTVGMSVDVRLDAYSDDPIQGRIERVYPYLDTSLRTRTIEITLGRSVNLLPGMFARLKLLLKSEGDSVIVPVEALVSTPNGQVVFVVEDGKATAKMVKTGIEAGNRIQVVLGITPGDKVIIAGNEKLKNGAKVHVAENQKPGKGKGMAESSVGKPGKIGDRK